MINIKIDANDSNQRLDRFLKKFFKKAALSQIYKIIRKSVKLNGKRVKEATILKEDDIITFYISQEEFDSYRVVGGKTVPKVKKNFKVIYEDESLLVVSKPFGLLTHGSSTEKKNHLANQVIDYLIEKKEFIPAKEKTFSPSPVNRLDRNTTGLVIFGKTAKSLKELNKKIKDRKEIKKYYLTIVSGVVKDELKLQGSLIKDEKTNRVRVIKNMDENIEGKYIETTATPIANNGEYTLLEVELVTGRTHQIRAHLSANGHSIIGDSKYGDFKINQKISKKYGLTTQFLHAYKLNINGIEIVDKLPDNLNKVMMDLFPDF